MARGRRSAKRESAIARAIEAEERAAVELAAAQQRAAVGKQLLKRWGGARGALDRLGAVSRDLEEIHREESKLLRERDDLVTLLRREGQSWNALSARTRLSRQALMKRPPRM
ncbi:hypothetical protein GCM10025773_33210 [Microbacterium jejuense]